MHSKEFRDRMISSLRQMITRQQLSRNAQTILVKLATDPHGIHRDLASAIVAPMIDGTNTEADIALRELYGKQLIIETQVNNEPRIVANYNLLGISEEEKSLLISPLIQFEIIGQPHSQNGMVTLRQFFDDPSEIYVLMGITAHNVFDSLDERAKSGKKTVFFFPAKKHISDRQKRHYTEVLNGWVTALNDGPRYMRDNVQLQIVNIGYWDVYTSALSSSVARINLNHSSSSSTRDGTIIQVESSSSLYAMYKERIQSIYDNSRPILRLKPGLWSRYILTRAAWPITLASLGVVCAAYTNVYAGVTSSIAIGLLRVWIWDTIKVKAWSKHELFLR